ncbi:putative calcium-binding protein CML45 [Canna indica]|uniref:Calcium-binding protein CML45 n=1 Tax=Canna indica TaxID=4628 RepID=A0AAQ3KA76_9LILI|nr:putative calcium-binding protein CML45 [Canna indica]
MAALPPYQERTFLPPSFPQPFLLPLPPPPLHNPPLPTPHSSPIQHLQHLLRPLLTSDHTNTTKQVMEKLASLAEPVGFLFLHTILNWIITFIHKFPVCSSTDGADHQRLSSKASRITQTKAADHLELRRDDMEMLMDMMGLYDGEQLGECSSDELSSLFEEKEPSLEEVKETFCVFDDNGDGFIDAAELQRVLTRLGFVEGLELAACERMIELYDDNGDGKIDFLEFVKFMEIGFC